MADDSTPATAPDPTPAPAAPAFDADALSAQIADRLKASFQSAPAPQPTPQPQPRVQDPVADMLAPYVQPIAAQARLAEESATDAAEFYAGNRDIEPEDRTEVERRFKALRSQGVPFKRTDIYNHLLGERIDKEVEKRIEKRNKQVKVAADAATVGGGSPDKGGAGAVRNAADLSTADLEKAMQGQSF